MTQFSREQLEERRALVLQLRDGEGRSFEEIKLLLNLKTRDQARILYARGKRPRRQAVLKAQCPARPAPDYLLKAVAKIPKGEK